MDSDDAVDRRGLLGADGIADCINEYAAIQDCFVYEWRDHGFPWDEIEDVCRIEGALADSSLLKETDALYDCTKAPNENGDDCTTACFDLAD